MKSAFLFRPALVGITVSLALAACQSAAPARQETVGTRPSAPQPAPGPQVEMAVADMSARANYATKAAGMPIIMPPPERIQLPVQDTERYGQIDTNPVQAVAQQPVSTFSIDVDTGSYANSRRFLNNGRLPPADAVRIEELVNYFDYDYALPADGKPFAVHTETVDSPWQPHAKLIKIGIKAHDLAKNQRPRANLVFLVDVSGSMNSENKLPLVKHSLRLLTEELREQDTVTIITYASGEKLVLPPTSGKNKQAILRVINELKAGGATAGEQAIQMAYKEAEKSFVKNGINRILLATDGDFNVGITDFNTLKNMVAEKRRSGISLTTLGFGTGNYNEHLMEQLADAGDGNYSYIDTRKEAKKVLQRQLSSTLVTVAQDVKIQVEFNPATVKEYRLVGYENRMLKQEDFNNDKVDAGDIGAGHSVTALYEIIPAGQAGWLEPSRYQNTPAADGSKDEYAFVKLRYKLPGKAQSLLISQPVAARSKPWSQAQTDTRFAVAVAAYGQQLRGGQYNGKMGWPDIIRLAQNSAKPDPHGLREEFVELAKIAQSLSSRKPGTAE
ncbi:Ca-activated chloride channel family protein [Neisseria sp. HSC-16F19]|nr:VWA domain-containing protein [Neisseria sp. HSC-16F19]MCP2039507.1 Ca-activated chloride channel family protein [Neisseria sp. HSC-16F19]